MQYPDRLVEIIKSKKFKTFWHCLDYLLLAGYTPMEAFGVTLKEFGESRIYSDVAFIRINRTETIFTLNHMTGEREQRGPKFGELVVGLINENNKHLSGIYEIYRNRLNKNNRYIESEIEGTCEIIKPYNLTYFLYDYLLMVSQKHFGLEIFKPLSIEEELDTRINSMRHNHTNAPGHYNNGIINHIPNNHPF